MAPAGTYDHAGPLLSWCFFSLTICVASQLCTVFVFGFWAAALYFFQRGSMDWTLPPAQARASNTECVVGDYFDDHDVWHCLSAYGTVWFVCASLFFC